MKRQIKFRGKSIYNNEWVYGNLRIFGERAYISAIDSHAQSEVHLSTISQFTGLTDSNGKEIYEGNILKVTQIRPKDSAPIDRGVCVVKFCPWYGWSLGTDKIRYEIAAKTPLGPIDRIDIIGNIHDNPELINQPTEV